MSIATKNVIREIARRYNLRTEQEEQFFNILWEVFQVGNKYKRKNKDQVEADLEHNYRALVASILNKNRVVFDMPMIGEIPLNFSKNNVFDRIKTLNLDGEIIRGNRTGASRSGSANRTSSSMTRPSGSNRTGSEMKRESKKRKGPTKFVVFSDHHITPNDHAHNYFSRGKNKDLYKAVLNYYADENYGLIENGDVEEYTIFEPTTAIVNRYDRLVDKRTRLGVREDIGSIEWADLRRERLRNRVRILRRILANHSDLYEIIDKRFASKGSSYYTKITGNHDPYLEPAMVRTLPSFLRDNLCDGLRLNSSIPKGRTKREPKYFVTHGHQFDTTTLPQHAFALGEVISETLGWFIQGADRIWNERKTGQWRMPEINSSFRNILATAKNDRNFSKGIGIIGEGVYECLMQEHEIAWEYFDEPKVNNAVTKEVLTGDEYFKVRHLSETKLVGALSTYQRTTELSSYQSPTKLIIGHTHEPRLNSKKAENNDSIVTNYINSGSAGRFDNLIWGVELIDGTEKIISWTNISTRRGRVVLHRDEWVADGDGEFTKTEYPM